MTIVDNILKGCEHDGSFIPVSEVKRMIKDAAWEAWKLVCENWDSSEGCKLNEPAARKQFDIWYNQQIQ